MTNYDKFKLTAGKIAAKWICPKNMPIVAWESLKSCDWATETRAMAPWEAYTRDVHTELRHQRITVHMLWSARMPATSCHKASLCYTNSTLARQRHVCFC